MGYSSHFQYWQVKHLPISAPDILGRPSTAALWRLRHALKCRKTDPKVDNLPALKYNPKVTGLQTMPALKSYPKLPCSRP